jgi:hypothetical protein
VRLSDKRAGVTTQKSARKFAWTFKRREVHLVHVSQNTTPPNRPLRRSEAVGYALINQFATPGLGSWMGRRRVAGAGQLALALLGFFMLVGWIFAKFWLLPLRDAGVDIKAPALMLDNPNALGIPGAIAFGIAWLWALVTSFLMIVQAKRDGSNPPPMPSPPPVPPA